MTDWCSHFVMLSLNTLPSHSNILCLQLDLFSFCSNGLHSDILLLAQIPCTRDSTRALALSCSCLLANLCSQISSLLFEFSCTNPDKICQLIRGQVYLKLFLPPCGHVLMTSWSVLHRWVILLSIIAPQAFIKILNSKDSYFIDYSLRVSEYFLCDTPPQCCALLWTMLLTEERIKALKYYCASNDTSECRNGHLLGVKSTDNL